MAVLWKQFCGSSFVEAGKRKQRAAKIVEWGSFVSDDEMLRKVSLWFSENACRGEISTVLQTVAQQCHYIRRRCAGCFLVAVSLAFLLPEKE